MYFLIHIDRFKLKHLEGPPGAHEQNVRNHDETIWENFPIFDMFANSLLPIPPGRIRSFQSSTGFILEALLSRYSNGNLKSNHTRPRIVRQQIWKPNRFFQMWNFHWEIVPKTSDASPSGTLNVEHGKSVADKSSRSWQMELVHLWPLPTSRCPRCPTGDDFLRSFFIFCRTQIA